MSDRLSILEDRVRERAAEEAKTDVEVIRATVERYMEDHGMATIITISPVTDTKPVRVRLKDALAAVLSEVRTARQEQLHAARVDSLLAMVDGILGGAQRGGAQREGSS